MPSAAGVFAASGTLPARVAAPTRRIDALDGLRGAAAVIVVIHHGLLVVPSLAAAYFGQPVTDPFARLLSYTPLHLVWAGGEAVILFFVLSGVVLARSATRDGFSWGSYIPSRLARLYVPVFGAIILGVVNYRLVPRVPYDGMSAWLAAHPTGYPVASALSDAVVITGSSGAVSPLWSLSWEVLFSLLLAAYVALSVRTSIVLQFCAAAVLTVVGIRTGIGALQYLPMFLIGTALGTQWDTVAARVDSVMGSGRRASVRWALALVVASVGITSFWVIEGFGSREWGRPVATPIILLGVVVWILAAALWSPLRALLSSRLFRWLGAVSFSLYLVHEPIIVAAAFLTHGRIWAIPVSIAVSFVIAQAFWVLVERPGHRLAKRLARVSM